MQFTVQSKNAGATRIFDGPCTQLKQVGSVPVLTTLTCDAFMHGEPRHDYDTGKDDPLWFHLIQGGWVPSAHTEGYPPGVKP